MIGEKHLLVQNGWTEQAMGKLRSMQKSGYLCDMYLEADSGAIVPCHSCVMIANIPWLGEHITRLGKWPKGSKAKVRERLKGLSMKAIEQVVLFCYGGFLEVMTNDLASVHEAAKRLCFDQLVEACEHLLRERGTENVNSSFSTNKIPFSELTSGENIHSNVKPAQEQVFSQAAKTLETLEHIVKVEISADSVNEADKGETDINDYDRVCSPNPLGTSSSVVKVAAEEEAFGSSESESGTDNKMEAEENLAKESSSDLTVAEEVSEDDSEATDIVEDTAPEVEDVKEEKATPPQKMSRKKRGKGTKKEFKCSICEKVLVSNCALRDHMNGHNGLKPYKCQKCDKCFAARGSLKEHMQVHRGMTFPCDKCGKIFYAKKQMVRHWKNHPADYVPKSQKHQECKCDICGKVFSYLKSLNDHINIHKGLKPYKCDLCDKSYSVEASLQDHKIKHRAKEFPCRYCGKFLPSQKKLRKHVKCHGEKILEQANEELKHKCEECGRLFYSPFNLKQHIKQIHMAVVKMDQYICQVCGKILKTKHGMDLHVVGCTDKGQFKCDFCGKHYVTKSGMEKHITWAHRKEMLSSEKYSKQVKLCKYCGQSFLCRGLLMEHEKTHSKERNYKCDICGKTFKSHNNVLTHKRNVHVKTENLFRCDICNTIIKSSGAFKRHKRMHLTQPVHQCENCGKGYNRKDMLNQHLLNCKKFAGKPSHLNHLPTPAENTANKGVVCIAPEMGAASSAVGYGEGYGMASNLGPAKIDPPGHATSKEPDMSKMIYIQQQQQHHSETQMYQIPNLPALPNEPSLAHVQQNYGLSQVEQNFCRL